MGSNQPDIELQAIGDIEDSEAQVLTPVRTRFSLIRGNSLISEVQTESFMCKFDHDAKI